LVSYQTAYIKANFPVEYMAALCTSEIGRSSLAAKEVESKMVSYLGDCKDMGIEVLPPDVQKSGSIFIVESAVGSPKPQIRFGLLALKNVGEGAVESIIESRRKNGLFESLDDFCGRVDTRLTNRKVVESLVKAGAFDSFLPLPSRQSRPRLLEQVEPALNAGAKLKADQDFMANSLFGEEDLKATRKSVRSMGDSTAEWTEHDLLANEKDVLGLYLSGHPLSRFTSEIASYATSTLSRLPDNGIARVAGHLLSVRRMTTKRGNIMARFSLEDLGGQIEVIVFPNSLTPEVNALLTPGAMLVVKGKVQPQDSSQVGSDREILAEEILSFAAARERFVRNLTITVKSTQFDDAIFNQLKELYGKFPGHCRVNLLLQSERDGNILLETRAGIKPTADFIAELEKVLGPESWQFGATTGTPKRVAAESKEKVIA
jgi:DNA polymerase-3 subunit alpha